MTSRMLGSSASPLICSLESTWGLIRSPPLGRKETGSTAALPIWLDYRLAVEQNYPAQDFKVPPNIVFRHVASWNTNADYYLPFDVNAQQRFYEEDFLYSDGGMTYESDKAYQQSYKQYDYNRDAVPDQERIPVEAVVLAKKHKTPVSGYPSS